MAYEIAATAKTPALIVYLIDSSGSMTEPLDGLPRIDHVNAAMKKVLGRMIRRSTKGEIVSPRYRVAIAFYNSTVTDVTNGVRTIKEVAAQGTPRVVSPVSTTDTAAAFRWALALLRRELPALRGHPAPMVCHLTDGAYTGDDPEPVAREVMGLSNDDGAVLVENIYVGPSLTARPITDAKAWPGVLAESDLTNTYARKLLRMSSPLPASYANTLREDRDYALQAGCGMLLPANTPELIEVAFAMSGATPVG
jgi:hypothetical protein